MAFNSKTEAHSLDAVADMLLSMTYGEMTELSSALSAKMGEGKDVAKGLYEWAVEHKRKSPNVVG